MVRQLAVAVTLAAIGWSSPASAQEVGGEAAPEPTPASAEGDETGGRTVTTPETVVVPPVVNTRTSGAYGGLPPPGTDVDSHLPSSSRTLDDINAGDSFDFRHRVEGSGATMRGDPNAPGILADEVKGGTGVYLVRRGDTLSSISERIYGQPWMWPKLWSLNPQIQNPHWIYPGDQIRLSGFATPASKEVKTLGGGGFKGLRKTVPADTVFLRRHGYIDDPGKGIVGELVGAHEPVQMMAEGNTVYLVIREGKNVAEGQLLTIFRPVRRPPKVKGARRPPGKIIAIKGTVQVDHYDPKARIARAQVVESLDVIERGAKVGFVERRFEIVPPKRVQKNVTARVLTSIFPHVFVGKHQVVFIDRGKHDGLQKGNRLFVIRRGDTWRRTLDTASIEARSRIKMNVPEKLQIEVAPLHGDEQKFPEEVVGELRVIETHKFSAFAVVTESSTEILPGDRAVARTGF